MALQIRNTHTRYAYVGWRPVYGPSAFGLPRAIWKGIVEAPADVPKAEEVQPIGKGSRERRTRRTPLLCPLRTTSLKIRFSPEHSPYLVLPTNSAPVGGRARTTPKDADGSVTPAEGPWKGIATPPSSHNPLVLANSLYIQVAGYRDCDIIGERGNHCRKRASKRDTAQSRICPLIPKPTEQGLQSEDKRRQEAVLSDRTLCRKRLRTPSIHLYNCLYVVIHHANPSAELRLESDSLQKPMVNPIEDIGLI